MISDKDLIEVARKVAVKHVLTEDLKIGSYGAALVTDKGNVYTGVTVNMPCDMGFCAEHNAVGNMITQGEYKVKTIVAVKHTGAISSPCGMCREFLTQLDPVDKKIRVILGEDKVRTIGELLPEAWR